MIKVDQKVIKTKTTPKVLDQKDVSIGDPEPIRKILENIENDIQKIKHLLFTKEHKKQVQLLNKYDDKNGTIIEGIFDGENMIGRDEKKYTVPSNYASKSKLVSGDLLKLTIIPDGSFVFKQIGPVERKKLIGDLKESHGRFYVFADGKKYHVLLASITYFKLRPDDKVTIIIPKEEKTDWAAIENIIEKN